MRSTTENSFADCGVCVVERNDSNYDNVVRDITADLLALMATPAAGRAAISKAAMATAAAADWSKFIGDYQAAFDIALDNHNKK